MKEKISMILFIGILGSFLTAALLSVNDYTEPFIKRNKVKKLKMSVLKSLEIPHSENNFDSVFSNEIIVNTIEDKKFYVSKDMKTAFEISGSGLWGPIEGIIAIDQDYQLIKGITLLYQEETPGLGGRIAEPAFLNSFKEKSFLPDLKILSPGKATAPNEIDGISGATMTSKLFETLLNNNLQSHLKILKGN